MTRKALGRGLGALIPGAPSPHAQPDEASGMESTSPSEGGPTVTVGAAPAPPAPSIAAATPVYAPVPAAETAATTATAVEAPTLGTGVQEIPLDRILPNPKQPRMDFGDEALRELAESIRAQGVLQPILVRPAGDRFQLIAGERRYRAAQQIGLGTIPAIVRAIDDDHLLEVALIENLQREDLNPIEEALGYQRLIDELGYTHERMSERVGKNRTSITNTLRLLALPAPVQTMVSRGTLTAGHARPLLGLPSAAEIEAAARYVVDMGLSARKTEALVARKLRRKTASRRPRGSGRHGQEAVDAVSSAYAEWNDRLRRHLATQVRIEPAADGTGAGKIVIEYYSEPDLERLLELLGVVS